MIDLHPTVCNLCGGKVIYTSNKNIYGKKQGSGFCYLCTQCGAHVGPHVPHPKEAYGVLADSEMRLLKSKCHEMFDKRWIGHTQKRRRREYQWLADQMGIPLDECHFGYFTKEQLLKAYNILLNDRKQKEAQFAKLQGEI